MLADAAEEGRICSVRSRTCTPRWRCRATPPRRRCLSPDAPPNSGRSWRSCCGPTTPTSSSSSKSVAAACHCAPRPIDVSAIVREHLLDPRQATVLTSATLSIGGSFEYIRSRLGVTTPRELCVPSEFDFTRQAILYLPSRMPDPRAVTFGESAAREIIEVLRRTKGRAFVLFTSYAVLRTVEAIARTTLGFPLLVQGSAPRSILLQQFRSTANAVLLATSSFWQGVDVVGEALGLRHRGQVAVRLAGRPDHGRPHGGHRGRRRRPIQRVPGSAGNPDAAAGPRATDPPPPRPGRPRGARPAARERKATGDGFLRPCPPRP